MEMKLAAKEAELAVFKAELTRLQDTADATQQLLQQKLQSANADRLRSKGLLSMRGGLGGLLYNSACHMCCRSFLLKSHTHVLLPLLATDLIEFEIDALSMDGQETRWQVWQTFFTRTEEGKAALACFQSTTRYWVRVHACIHQTRMAA